MKPLSVTISHEANLTTLIPKANDFSFDAYFDRPIKA